ncbi:MAG TPA: hypothetical protein VE869_02420 [Gemmatimonas sp.]|nr:hypothetical protein [Gemmatimonas sp.]
MIKQSLLAVLCAAALGALPGTGSAAGAQAPKPKAGDSVPREYRPPAGMCRIWIEGVPAAQQPAPTDCPTAVKNKPANGKVVYGETPKGKGKRSDDRLPVKSFLRPGAKRIPPVIPPDIPSVIPPDEGTGEFRGR